jgi:hypothetical protein
MGEARSPGPRSSRRRVTALSGRYSRNKGANFERLIANTLKPYWPGARRGIGQARSSKEVADVEGTPYWIECKRQKRCSIKAAIRQAEAATDGRPIWVITKNDKEPVMITYRHYFPNPGVVNSYWATTTLDEFLSIFSPVSSKTLGSSPSESVKRSNSEPSSLPLSPASEPSRATSTVPPQSATAKDQ